MTRPQEDPGTTPRLALTLDEVSGAFTVFRYLYAHLADPAVDRTADYACTVRFIAHDVAEAIRVAAPASVEANSATAVTELSLLSVMGPLDRRSTAPHVPPAALVVRDGDAAGVGVVTQYLLDLRDEAGDQWWSEYYRTLAALTGDLLRATGRYLHPEAEETDVPR